MFFVFLSAIASEEGKDWISGHRCFTVSLQEKTNHKRGTPMNMCFDYNDFFFILWFSDFVGTLQDSEL